MIQTRGGERGPPLTTPQEARAMTYPTACPLPTTVPTLTPAQRQAITDWIRELTREGRHLEASTLHAEYFPFV